jgi:hypothetical protein
MNAANTLPSPGMIPGSFLNNDSGGRRNEQLLCQGKTVRRHDW